RRADRRVDGGEGGAGAGGAVARGGRDLQPAQGGDAAGYRRDDPLRAGRARHAVAARVSARQQLAVQHTPARGPAADPDREPGARLASGRRAPGGGELPLLRPQAGQGAPLLHGQRGRLQPVSGPARLRPEALSLWIDRHASGTVAAPTRAAFLGTVTLGGL